MMQRRQFLSGVVATAVAGFDPATRQWIAAAAASPGGVHGVPPLDGELVFDAASRAAVSTDVGNAFVRTPFAVLRPGSVRDIQKMLKFCAKRGIKVAARGQGHTTFGQSLVEGGLSIEMASLSTVHSIDGREADVGAGLKWRDLVAQTVEQGLTPPVLTGYLGLSIGGTLSVGGISSTPTRGAQVDHVKELEVVTGDGEVVRCSERRNRELFDSVLAGLGQCAVITRAVLELVPAPELARVYLLNYTDNATFFHDLRRLLARGEFDDVYNLWVPDGAGGWIYQLNAVKFFTADSPPDDAALLRNLQFDSSSLAVQDLPFLAYVSRVDAAIDFFRSIGLWDGVLHPWFDVFLPDRAVEAYVGDVVPSLTPEDVGPTGFMLLFPQRRRRFDRPLLRVPNDEWIYLFDILTAAPAPGPDPAFQAAMVARNRRLFEKARACGGTRYPIGTLPFSKVDWFFHYGAEYWRFWESKRRFDPSGILTPGPGIF